MKSKGKYMGYVLGGIGTLIVSLYSYLFLAAPEMGIDKELDFKNRNIVNDTLCFTVNANLQNKYFFGITLDTVESAIFLNDTKIGSLESINKSKVSSNSVSKIPLSLKFPLSNIATIAKHKADTLNLAIKGDAEIGFPVFSYKKSFSEVFNFAMSDIPLLEMPDFSKDFIAVKSAKLKTIDLNKSVVEINFDIKNPATLAVTLQNYSCKLFINDKYCGDGDIKNPILVEAKPIVTNGKITFEIDNGKLLFSLPGSLFSLKIQYRTEGVMTVKYQNNDISVPFNFKGDLIKI